MLIDKQWRDISAIDYNTIKDLIDQTLSVIDKIWTFIPNE